MGKPKKYLKAVDWVALNDEPGDLSIDTVAMMLTTHFVADLFNKSSRAVAKDVVNRRIELGQYGRTGGK